MFHLGWGSARKKVSFLSPCHFVGSLRRPLSYRRDIVKGKAQPQETLKFFQKHQKVPYRKGKSGLCISRAGLGTLRVKEENDDALKKAIRNGINVIDTSANYSNGHSEITVGNVIEDLVKEHEVSREEIVLINKVGVAQGESFQRVINSNISDVDQLDPASAYCIDPEFIEQELTRSLDNIGLETIDFYLLNNPEDFFRHREQNPNTFKLFESRLQKAFKHLEKEVKRGRIQYFGISSSALQLPSHHSHSMSLDYILNCSNNSEYFAAVQFPLNLFEMDILSERNSKDQSTTNFEIAKKHNLFTFSNRPLNVILSDDLVFPLKQPPSYNGIDYLPILKEAFNNCIRVEKIYPGADPKYDNADNEPLPDYQELSWGQVIASNSKGFDLLKFQYFVESQVTPRMDQHIHTLSNIEGMENWALAYKRAVNHLLDYYTQYLCQLRSKEIATVESNVLQIFPYLSGDISQKALQLVLSTEVDCVLTGMRSEQYVDSLLKLFSTNPESPPINPQQLQQLQTLTQLIKNQLMQKYTIKK